MAVKPIPEGYASVTPILVMKGAAKALDWYKEALGADELFRMPGPDGRIMHAEIRIGNSMIMMCDEFPEMPTGWRSPETLGGVTGGIWIYTEDCDGLYDRALKAGAKSESAPVDMFWGDRYGRITDPFGHSWALATHVKDVSPEEMAAAQQQYASAQQGG